MNHLGQAMMVIREKNMSGKRPAIVQNNTFAFAHDETDPPMGKGGERGVAIRLSAAAQIENNAFVACGNSGMNIFAKPTDVSINRNVFWLALHGDVAARADGRELLITDKNLEEMEDIGFKSSKDNKVVDVGLTGLKPEWVEGVSRQLLFAYATPPKEAIATLRSRYKLSEPEKPSNSDDKGPTAPLLDANDACSLRVTGDAGAKPVDLKPQFGAATAQTAPPAYAPMTWADLNAGAPSLEGKPVEVLVAIGQERNGFVRNGLTAEKYIGFDVYYPGGERFPDQINVYAVRNGAAHRQFQEANKSTNAREAEDWYLLRGIAHLTTVTRQKGTIEVQSIVPGIGPAKAIAARPKGKEWFIRAGASSGDGTREKPFRDPFQALEKASDGDILRIATGDYFGKLRTANWKTANKYLAILGGYDADFKTRDPWKNPTRLVMSADAEKKDKSQHGGQFLQSAEICTGLILDGLIFDGSTVNGYAEAGAGGGLDMASSPFAAMVQLQGSDITIRNCVFVNASGQAVELGSSAGTFENNVVANTSGTGLAINAMGPGPWIIRQNTFLFTTDPTQRAGSGFSAAGTHITLSGRAAFRVENNFFAFADNNALRASVARDKLAVDNNVFGPDLCYHFSDSNRVWLFDEVWNRRLPDAGLASAKNNSLVMPANLPLNKEYVDKVLPRLFTLKGRYTREQWAKVAATAGASVTPPADAGDAAPATEKPKVEKKEQSLEDLMGELNKLKEDSGKPAAAKGPTYAPVYPWKAAVELTTSATPAGAHQMPLQENTPR